MKKIEKILIGTHNKGKFKEISDLLPNYIEKISPLELDIESPEENGKTFLENSQIKANFFCKKSNLITLSDDSGIEIDDLNGEPGIYSARWEKKFGSFEKAMLEILKKLKNLNKKNSTAKFVSSLTIQWPGGKSISEVGIIEGKITSMKGQNGFGYDPIFIPEGYTKTFAEMEYKDKLAIDHRYLSYKKLEKKIKDYFL
tara:strand:+ start:702 stop:1298 length:597 start_codon:yes stop_codon:yes gene_type:complete